MVTTRQIFDEQLKNLQYDLIRMASLVEQAMDSAIVAIREKNTELAKQIVQGDDEVDELERIIERKCIELIATQQPIAKDLRMITSILKMITDLERIADQAADMSELILQIKEKEYIKPLVDIPKMAYIARDMVKNALDAYINRDKNLAIEVCKKDNAVDEYYEVVVTDLQVLMGKDPENIHQATIFMFIAKYLERIADHATNIAEWVIYNITGEHDDLNH